MKKVLMIFLCFMTIFTVGCNETVKVERNENADAWIEDLQTMKEKLPTQAIALSKADSTTEWEENIGTLIKDIDTKNMSDIEINYRANEILATVKDGHFSFRAGYDLEEKYIPIFFKVIGNEEVYVSQANKEYEKYLGAKLISINDVPTDNILDGLIKITPHDNTEWVYSIFEMMGLTEGQLNYLDIGKEVNLFKFEMSNGDVVESEIKSINSNEFDTIHISDGYEEKAIKYQKPDDAFNEYWYKVDESNNAFYFQYNSCIDKAVAPELPHFRDFSDEMIEYMKLNDDKFDIVVIDLRNNLGGYAELLLNSYIRNNLEYLKEKDIKILVGKHTFSAGISAINDLYENFDIKSYGIETGGLVGGYSLIKSLFLKNTSSNVVYSTTIVSNPKLLEMGCDEWNGFIPDVIVEDSVEDFRLGIDSVYETAVKDK